MKGPKVKISTGRINIEVAMESSEQADWHATQLASMLFQVLEEEQEKVAVEETENAPDEKKKVKGFVYIKCIHCGAISGRCLKNQADHFTCPECGKETELDDLRELSVNCECGKRFFYQTNIRQLLLFKCYYVFKTALLCDFWHI